MADANGASTPYVNGINGYVTIDEISASAPEPSTAALLGFALLALTAFRRRIVR
jgi:hypothetical protein